MMWVEAARAASTSPRENAVVSSRFGCTCKLPGACTCGASGAIASERIGHRLIYFVIDVDLVRGLARVEHRIRHHQRENIADAARGLADGDKDRQVRNRKTGAALPGNIARGEDPFNARHGLRRRSIDRENLGARVRTQQRARRAACRGRACRPRKAFRREPVRAPDIARAMFLSHSRA